MRNVRLLFVVYAHSFSGDEMHYAVGGQATEATGALDLANAAWLSNQAASTFANLDNLDTLESRACTSLYGTDILMPVCRF